MAICMLIWKPRSSTDRWTARKPCWSWVCQRERRTREILPRLSFNLLISRLSTSLCMVFGRCCISLKMKSWREDSYCVEKKYIYIYWSYFLQMDISEVGIQSWSTHRGCGILWHKCALAGPLKTRITPQQFRGCKDGVTCNAARDPAASVAELTPDYQGEKNRCKKKTCSL